MKTLYINFFIFSLLAMNNAAMAQNPLEKRYTVKAETSLIGLLDSIENTTNDRFFYLKEWLAPLRVPSAQTDVPLNSILRETLADTEISFLPFEGYAVIFVKDPTLDIRRMDVLESARRTRKKVEQIKIGTASAQNGSKKTVQLSGKITDTNSHEPVVGATLYVTETDTYFSTDAEGKFSLKLMPGEYVLSITSMNYEEKVIHFQLQGQGILDVVLEPMARLLDEVVITDEQMVTKRLGQATLKLEDLKRAPALLGEPDLLKQIQLQSGVTTASEASSGYHVRGGGIDQNLVLYDDVQIFNTSHALGFLTAFNAEAIRSASFFKGQTPAEYGGRAASVLDISSKEGNFNKWSAAAGISLLSANAMIEGPIKKDTTSIVLSGRMSYSDWILKTIKTRYKGIKEASVGFYDGSLKLTHKFSKNDKLVFTAYNSSDDFKLWNDTTYQWQSTALALQYYNNKSSVLSYRASLSMGYYKQTVSDTDVPTAFDLNYSITYPALKLDFIRNGDNAKQHFGFQSTYYAFNPGQLKRGSEISNAANVTMPKEVSIESAVYGSNEFHLTDRLTLEAGLRLTMFNRIGKTTVFKYEEGQPRDPKNTIDSVNYGAGQIVKTYLGPEPRLNFQFIVNQNSSFKFGYNRLYQYVHLITNSANVTPVDIWQSSNYYFKPQIADQFSGGYFRSPNKGKIEFSIEAFYKKLQNLLDFKDGERLLLNRQLETALLSGKGYAYGVEVVINKTTGRLTGNLNYTYSRSFRQVNDGPTFREQVNNGKWYRSNFDQPHILNLSWKYNIVRRLFFSGLYSFHTGRPISLPLSAYTISHYAVSEFSDRNSYRVPNYQRIDVALILEPGYRKSTKLKSTWTFSLYNLTGRKNPYSVFFADGGGGALLPYQLSLIGSVIPSLTYSMRF